MSFRYRTIGYSPEYAITTGGSPNQFHNDNSFESGSSVTIKTGSSLTLETGVPLVITDAPTVGTHSANKTYVDDGLALKLSLTGGDMTGTLTTTGNITQTGATTLSTGTGAISLNGNVTLAATKTITLSGDPTSAMHPATKQYADTKLSLAGGTMTGALVLASGPTLPLHPATMSYVDAKLGTFDAGDGLFITPINVNKSGTYTQSGTTVTITITNHGLSFGSTVAFTFTGSPKPADGSYSISSVTGPNTFTITSGVSQTASGNADFSFVTNQVSISSTTLEVNTDDIQLQTIHSGTFLGGSSYSDEDYYDSVMVDGYGRIVDGKKISVSATDGWYNKMRVQGGVVTNATNEDYLTQNQPISISSTTISGTSTNDGASTTLSIDLKVVPGLTAGSYTKVDITDRGQVVGASNLTPTDIATALGFMPSKDSGVQLSHYKGSFTATSWGTAPFNPVLNSGYNGYTVSGSKIYLPKGIYQITYWGSNNWYSVWAAAGWYWWWESYWNYYYNPSVIYKNGNIIQSCFANYGGWWWYYNSSYKSSESADFLLTDTIEITGTQDYIQFGMPMLSGVTYWYNAKIVKIK